MNAQTPIISTTVSTVSRPSQPRPSPYQVGWEMGSRGSLVGLPYGPGARQEQALLGYREAKAIQAQRRSSGRPTKVTQQRQRRRG